MIEFLVFDKDDIEALANNKIVNADIGRPIVCCSREYFESQRREGFGLQEEKKNENLCDECKLADTCIASLKGLTVCKTTKCFRRMWAETEAEKNEQAK